MRDLKFRAFIDNEMVYLPFSALQYFDFEGSYAMSFVVDGYAGFWGHEMYERATKEYCTNAPIMQYTSLKDKNGKDIYEGDICRILYTDWPSNTDPHVSIDDYKKTISHYGQIIYEAPSFGIALKDRYGEMSFHLMMPGTHGEIEVIGNIYQNQDLL
jgi:uncharacterized phage protein (TIGR01671 family)